MNAILVEMLMKLLGVLVGELGQMVIAAILKLTSREVADRVGNLAVTHCRILMESAMSGPARRQAAFEGIVKDCQTLGIEARDWLIDTAIQAAVGKLKVESLFADEPTPEPEVA
jgi:hypothetical protein